MFDARKLVRLDEIGEIDLPPDRARAVHLPGIRQRFSGFDRNPYLASFSLSGTKLSVQLVNVHLYYGSDARQDIERRSLETLAMARWTALRAKSPYAGGRELIALGDFNMPKPRRDGSNGVAAALKNGGLVLPPHSSEVGSSIASDNHYDQVAMLPDTTKEWLVQVGVFDYDSVVFPDLWKSRSQDAFHAYLRYYLSDHRPMWVELRPR
jgi:endonuclease/exonuclease/phosphatase family metal-dependent hydrolase